MQHPHNKKPDLYSLSGNYMLNWIRYDFEEVALPKLYLFGKALMYFCAVIIVLSTLLFTILFLRYLSSGGSYIAWQHQGLTAITLVGSFLFFYSFLLIKVMSASPEKFFLSAQKGGKNIWGRIGIFPRVILLFFAISFLIGSFYWISTYKSSEVIDIFSFSEVVFCYSSYCVLCFTVLFLEYWHQKYFVARAVTVQIEEDEV